jgi:hypothetical protein
MQRFEYLTVYVDASGAYQTIEGTWHRLDELGEQGWELVSVVNDDGDLVAFFKRPGDPHGVSIN